MILSKRYYIETWGCQMNEEDSEKLSGMLANIGYEKTLFKDQANVIIFNTCAVRENAELKVYGNLGALKKLKRDNPELIIAVCGCMMQQKGMPEEILKKYRHVDIVFGTHNAYKFPEYLERARTEGVQVKEIFEKETEIVEGMPITRESTVTAYVTIMYGCNNFCTYCIVPYVRGRERSRKPEDILGEVRDLVSKGYREITLLGQNVNSYGVNLEQDINFAGLLRLVNEVEGLERIRFMTNHPKDLTDDVIEAVRDCSKVVEQVHLPVQSGSDALLKSMNRGYSKEGYLETVRKLKEKVPGVAISTDIIVGFPGETEEDFQGTLDVVETVGYDTAYTFIYSRRKHTPADRMTEQVSDKVKHERFNRLVEAVNRKSLERNSAYLGNIYEVLVEGQSKYDPEVLQGRTRTGKTVNFKGEEALIGNLVKVRISKVGTFSMNGDRVE